MRRARKSFCHIWLVRVDALKPDKMFAGTQPDLRRLEGHKAVDRAVDAEEAALMVHLDDGEPAFRTIRGRCDIVGNLLYGSDLLVPKLKRGVDDDAIKCAGIFLQGFLQIGAKRADVGGMILGIPQHLNLLEQTAAVREDGKRKIFIDMHLLSITRHLWDWLMPIMRECSAVGRTFQGFPPALQNICSARFPIAHFKDSSSSKIRSVQTWVGMPACEKYAF